MGTVSAVDDLRLDDYPAHRTITTRWMDEDVYGHVNNVTYYSYFDTAVNGHLIDGTGADVRRLAAVGIVAETSCVFRRELRFPADVTVGIAVERLGRTSIIYRLGIFQEPHESPAATGRFVHVYVDARTREPTPVPPPVRDVAGELVWAGMRD